MRSATITALWSLLTLVAPAVIRTERDVAPESTTTLGSPLQTTRTPESTTTLGSPLQLTPTPESTTTLGSPLQATRTPESTTTLGSPLQFTPTPESTTTLGSPLQFNRTERDVGPNSTTTLGSPLQSTRAPSPSPTSLKANTLFGPHYGWVGFFNSSSCSGEPIGDRPKMNDQACKPVHPTNETRQVKVYWGEWPLGFSKFDVFADEGCGEGTKVRTIVQGEGEECFEIEEGVTWGAVQNKV